MDCQEIVVRRSDNSPISKPPAQTNPTVQPHATNPLAATTPKPFDLKRITAFVANQYNESLGIVDVGASSVGVDTDDSFTGLLVEEPPVISVPVAVSHTSDDFLAVHTDYSSRRSLFPLQECLLNETCYRCGMVFLYTTPKFLVNLQIQITA